MSPCQCPMTDLQVSHLLCIPAPHGIFHIHDPGNAGDKSRCIPQHQLTRGGHTADPVHLDVEPGFWVSRSLLGHVQFSSVTQSCPSLCDPMDCSTPGFPVHHYSQSLLKLMSIELVMPSNHLILCHPLFLLPSIFPSFRIFSKDSVLRIRWPKYWSFSFSISPSNEYSGLISFRIEWFDLLAVQGTLKSFLQHHSSKASILQCSAFFIVQFSHPYMTTRKTIALTRQTLLAK